MASLALNGSGTAYQKKYAKFYNSFSLLSVFWIADLYTRIFAITRYEGHEEIEGELDSLKSGWILTYEETKQKNLITEDFFYFLGCHGVSFVSV